MNNNTPSSSPKKRGRPSKTTIDPNQTPTKTESPVSNQRNLRSLRKSIEIQEASPAKKAKGRPKKCLHDALIDEKKTPTKTDKSPVSLTKRARRSETSIDEKTTKNDKSPISLKRSSKIEKLSETSIDKTIELTANEELESTSAILPENQQHSDIELTTEAIEEKVEKNMEEKVEEKKELTNECEESINDYEKKVEGKTDENVEESEKLTKDCEEKVEDSELTNDCEDVQNSMESINEETDEDEPIQSSSSQNDLNNDDENATTSSNIQTTVKETVEQTSKNSITNIEKEFPILVSKEVKEIEAGTILIETKYHGTDSTKVVIYVNGNKQEENRKFKIEIVQDKEDESLYSIYVKINEANFSDSGNYCILLAEEQKRIILDYNIKIDPKFEKCWLTNNAECIRLPNGSVRLKFGIRSTGKFTTKWYHNGVELEDNQQHRETIDKKPNNRYQICLALQKASIRENEGTYLCEVQSEHNTLQATFNIELEDKCPTFVKEPTINIISTNGISSLILSVEYKSEIKSAVLWKGKTDELVDDNGQKLYKILTKTDKSADITTTQLKVKDYKPSEHTGIYLCEVSNESGTLLAELEVQNDETKENGISH